MLRLMIKGNPNVLKFDESILVLLQDDEFKHSKTNTHVVDQAFIANKKGKEKASNNTK